MKWALCVGLIVGVLIAHFAQAGRVDADHGRARCGGSGQIACIVTTSPFVDQVLKKQGDYTYCLNPRASAYAGFRSQVKSVTEAHAKSLKVTAREVPYPSNPADKSCAVRHDMPDTHGCSGCAAWIYVTSYPVVIEYKWQLGFVLWDATVGHELGHGECLMDESYIRATGQSHILTTGTWIHGYPTVMDTGTYLLSAYAPKGIWDLTPGDLDRCEETLGRDLDEPVEPPCGAGETVNVGGGVTATWDSCLGVWVFSNGYTFSPSNQWWGYRDVGFAPCDASGLRQIPALGATMPGLHSTFPWSLNYWISVPGC